MRNGSSAMQSNSANLADVRFEFSGGPSSAFYVNVCSNRKQSFRTLEIE
jgi:hypothetical protein